METSLDGNGKKNRRTVWSINTNGFKGAHFAVFPPALVMRLEWACPLQTERVVVMSRLIETPSTMKIKTLIIRVLD